MEKKKDKLYKLRVIHGKIHDKLIDERKIFDILTHRNIFVFGAPFHSNAGDQAQSYCIQKVLSELYPNYKIRVFDSEESSDDNFRLLHQIKKISKNKDKIFLHSGYHITDLYPLENDLIKKVIEIFSPHKIVILPQTINYLSEKNRDDDVKFYDYSNVLLMCRDKTSYEIAKRLYQKCAIVLFPDIVTSLIGKMSFKSVDRSGILLCIRNDQERLISKNEIEQIIEKLILIDTVDVEDTSLNISGQYFTQKRELILLNLWEKYSNYKVIITDRYHGTIFSLIAGTPVIVLPTRDHKVISGLEWFPESFSDYVFCALNDVDIFQLVKKIYSKELKHSLPPLFWENYYCRLKEVVEEFEQYGRNL